MTIATSDHSTKPEALPNTGLLNTHSAQRVTVLTRIEGLYEAALFERDAAIASTLLAELVSENGLTAAQILKARY